MLRGTPLLRVIAALALAACLLPAQRGGRVPPSAAVLACGSEIPWRTSVDEALAAAVQSGRPVLWYVPTVAGSRMDRKDVVDLYMMCGPFASPAVATLVTRRFVPVKARADGELVERYGLRFLDFVEPGILVLAPDGKVRRRLDRLTTFNERWFVARLRDALEGAPESESVAKARTSGDRQALAAALIDESAFEEALSAVGEGFDLMQASRPTQLLAVRAAAGRIPGGGESADDFSAFGLFGALALEIPHDPVAGAALIERGRLRLRRNRVDEAQGDFDKAGSFPHDRRDEASFFAGVCRWLTGRKAEARKLWEALAKARPESRWTRKAAAELERFGPFVRGFERFEDPLPGALEAAGTSTQLRLGEDDLPEIRRRSVAFLLAMQEDDGSWTDSNYDFGGQDSLPNVYCAVSALAALALHAHRDVSPEVCDTAVAHALARLADDERLAWDDKDEIVWAHAYRLLLFERLARGEGAPAKEAKALARRMVKHLAASQLEDGSWRHEYANPFATATVLHALDRGRRLGADAGAEVRGRGVKALAACRGEDGTFTYGMVRRRRGTAVEGAAGRMPLCELALLLNGSSDQERLVHAIETSFEHHPLIERVRKVDDHADAHANGGFFFWYDMLGRTLAIEAVEDAAKRRRLAARQRALILEVPEIDGTFQESHETGRVYATAAALLCLELLEPDRP